MRTSDEEIRSRAAVGRDLFFSRLSSRGAVYTGSADAHGDRKEVHATLSSVLELAETVVASSVRELVEKVVSLKRQLEDASSKRVVQQPSAGVALRPMTRVAEEGEEPFPESRRRLCVYDPETNTHALRELTMTSKRGAKKVRAVLAKMLNDPAEKRWAPVEIGSDDTGVKNTDAPSNRLSVVYMDRDLPCSARVYLSAPLPLVVHPSLFSGRKDWNRFWTARPELAMRVPLGLAEKTVARMRGLVELPFQFYIGTMPMPVGETPPLRTFPPRAGLDAYYTTNGPVVEDEG